MSALLTGLTLTILFVIALLLLYVRGIAHAMDAPYWETLRDVVRSLCKCD